MAAVDSFPPETFLESVSSPYHAFSVTPHDSNELAYVTRALFVGVSGNVKVTTINDETVTFYAIAGYEYRLRVKLIFAIGTAATGIVGVY